MMKSLRKKLIDKRGETITEVLGALLVSSLALVMLAGMITGATKLIERSDGTIREYVAEDARLVERDSSGLEESQRLLGNASVWYAGADHPIKLFDEDPGNGYMAVEFFKNDSISRDTVISYRVK